MNILLKTNQRTHMLDYGFLCIFELLILRIIALVVSIRLHCYYFQVCWYHHRCRGPQGINRPELINSTIIQSRARWNISEEKIHCVSRVVEHKWRYTMLEPVDFIGQQYNVYISNSRICQATSSVVPLQKCTVSTISLICIDFYIDFQYILSINY